MESKDYSEELYNEMVKPKASKPSKIQPKCKKRELDFIIDTSFLDEQPKTEPVIDMVKEEQQF